MIALRVTRRPGSSEPDATALALPPEGLTIGRSDDCGLVLADPLRLVSRQHAQVAPAGDAARIRCVSTQAPLWVNEVQLEPGGEHVLSVGDRLRIGRFELAVEPVAATAAQRPRLDRWFELDDAPDPLAKESPLPALAPSPDTKPVETLVLAETFERSPQREPSLAQAEANEPRVASVPAPAPAPAPVAASAVAAPAASRPARAAKAPRASTHRSADAGELAAAFARGAGLDDEAAALTPEWMEHVGALLRATAEGTLALLQSRAVTKRHLRAEGTHIAPRQNNPLKFSPDATEALTRMLQPRAPPGFLDPVAALRDAHHDLLVHQVAMVAGMRAAVFELFSRLGPEAAEKAEGPPRGVSHVPLLRDAALWRRYRTQHAQMLEHLDDDFEAIFGREFLRAYEAQSRVDASMAAAPASDPGPDAH